MLICLQIKSPNPCECCTGTFTNISLLYMKNVSKRSVIASLRVTELLLIPTKENGVNYLSFIQESCHFGLFIHNFLFKNIHVWLNRQQLSSFHLCPIENLMDLLCQCNFPRQCIFLFFTQILPKLK